MADAIDLVATARAGTGKGAARQSRRSGNVPGIIYGGSEPPMPIDLEFNGLLKRLRAGHFLSTLWNLKVEGQPDQRVVCRGVQRHARRMIRNARIAGRGVERSQPRRLRQLPGERMFAAPGPDQQDVDGFSPPRTRRPRSGRPPRRQCGGDERVRTVGRAQALGGGCVRPRPRARRGRRTRLPRPAPARARRQSCKSFRSPRAAPAAAERARTRFARQWARAPSRRTKRRSAEEARREAE